ncbi:alpha/beta hydrolase family protein [Actinokineospora diospyrosa]|uniref:Prolyl oligopeptidase family protein n=1 Tax=Actinokineospora diospyrosa TaxID=103728 RepID=A0ABT1IJ40_9PSEU|nr:prolyl oligopeptidase family serine peptidase [Actinokineospora diospyrosa]MCP2272669.1 Prolyl oligopeptidase family protein [Actinokineospora diospyrosa]
MSGERRWRDRAWEGGPSAELSAPRHPSLVERNPAVLPWRDVLLDLDLAGLAPGRALVEQIAITTGDGRTWVLPLSGVLATRLAWHPELPLVAGLVLRDRRACPWVADHRARKVFVHNGVRAAVSLLMPDRPPLAWCGGLRLALLTTSDRPEPVTRDDRPPEPTVLEAAGPAWVDLLPSVAALEQVAAARVAVFDHGKGELREVTEALLVSGVTVADGVLRVEHLSGAIDPGRGGPPDFGLCPGTVEVDVVGAAGAAVGEVADAEEAPTTGSPVPLGDRAFLTLRTPPEAAGPAVLWIHSTAPGEAPSEHAPPTLVETGCPVAVLDLSLHWPAHSTADLLIGQITTAVRAAVCALTARHPAAVVVGGHSFGATLALLALAHVDGLTAAIVHSGCYDRTSTPFGFQWEQRSYWEVPQVYQAFSAVHLADRLAGPVLVVHGTDDLNTATPPDQALGLYRTIVAAGGRARLVLLPGEGHNFQFAENLRFLTAEHATWLARSAASAGGER